MIATGFQQRLFTTTTAVLCLGFITAARGHDHPTPEQIQAMKEAGVYEERLQRVQRLAPHKVAPGLQQRAAFKVALGALQAQGLSPAEISDRLFAGRNMAFPYTAQPELRSTGTVRTLTVLIDFKDNRASDKLPGLTTQTIAQNIYGTGTAAAGAFAPYESVNAYYRRASQGRVDIQGSVLGWYGFSKNRSDYQPKVQGLSELEKAKKENRAIFDMVTEAMGSFDANHDFAQYDNDNDGDVDLVTILYAGEPTGWMSFWWAYRWEFFVAEASARKFDGKRLKQFVFQFVDTRGDSDSDFAPNTLLHEMGHAFGLPDYYDYLAGVGPDGGVGGLDMMDANLGNHNAFSRWLLDWIEPKIVGAGPPVARQLTASGATSTSDKALAVFPNLTRTDAPAGELFMIENRFRVGNDGDQAGAPGDGLLIWHVVATPNASDDGFEMDNSYTSRKLIRLVRADSQTDFGARERAGAGTYFRPPQEFTPTSSPSSHDYEGKPTNVAVTQISPPAETVTAHIGLLPPELEPGAAPPTPVAAADGGPGDFAAVSKEVEEVLSQQPVEVVDLDKLLRLQNRFETATPQEMSSLWQRAREQFRGENASRESAVLLQLIITHWAAKDGRAAAEAVLALPDGQIALEAYPRLMEAWAGNDPSGAAAWYFGPERKEVRNSKNLVAGEAFARQVVRWSAKNDLDAAVQSLDELRHVPEVWGALSALENFTETGQLTTAVVEEKLRSLKTNQKLIQSMRQFQNSLHEMNEHLGDAAKAEEMRSFLRGKLEGEPAPSREP